ncbi:hypothetical protein F5887DRAFT_1079032 [Amanita rubescens]|nr:hypothetical protein F5887DRAFT_1079032 [Amanita rubescens]
MPQAIDHSDLLKLDSICSELEGSSHPDTSSSSLILESDTGDKSARELDCRDYSTNEADPQVANRAAHDFLMNDKLSEDYFPEEGVPRQAFPSLNQTPFLPHVSPQDKTMPLAQPLSRHSEQQTSPAFVFEQEELGYAGKEHSCTIPSSSMQTSRSPMKITAVNLERAFSEIDSLFQELASRSGKSANKVLAQYNKRHIHFSRNVNAKDTNPATITDHRQELARLGDASEKFYFAY